MPHTPVHRSTSAEPVLEGPGVEELGAPLRREDPRYGPGFERVRGGQSRYLNRGGSGLEMVGIQEPRIQPYATDVSITFLHPLISKLLTGFFLLHPTLSLT